MCIHTHTHTHTHSDCCQLFHIPVRWDSLCLVGKGSGRTSVSWVVIRGTTQTLNHREVLALTLHITTLHLLLWTLCEQSHISGTVCTLSLEFKNWKLYTEICVQCFVLFVCLFVCVCVCWFVCCRLIGSTGPAYDPLLFKSYVFIQSVYTVAVSI